MLKRLSLALILLSCFVSESVGQSLELGTFKIDATPSVGSPLAYDPMKEATEPLSLRGVVLVPPDQKPIVLCSVDWLGVANESQDVFRNLVASEMNTTPQRVRIHSIHQHDAPRCDLSSAKVLQEYGLAEQHYDIDFMNDCFERAAQAAKQSLQNLQPITSIRFAQADVQEVASNRRMLGPNGKVHTTRYTACRDPKIRDLPEGTIDPSLKTLTFYSEDSPVAIMSFYATHPQSYYRTGQANPDFPGMARNQREQATSVFHLHFNGAGGNIGAGKYNDGAKVNRQILADKVAAAMQDCWEAQEDATSLKVDSIEWDVREFDIPAGAHLVEEPLRKILADPAQKPPTHLGAAKKLALLKRSKEGKKLDVTSLKVGDAYVLFMPGELFVEYQLAAQAIRPNANVLMAAYGEYGTGYIGTRIAYPQGGYEVSERASNVSPDSENVLLKAMKELLGAPQSRVTASDFTDTTGPLPKSVNP